MHVSVYLKTSFRPRSHRSVVQTCCSYFIQCETRAGFASVWLFTFFVLCWLCPEWGRVSSFRITGQLILKVSLAWLSNDTWPACWRVHCVC